MSSMILVDANPKKLSITSLLSNSLKMQLGLIIAFSLLMTISTPYAPRLIIIILFANFFLIFGENIILSIFPLLLLTLITDIAAEYRNTLVALLGLTMLFLFLKKYGLNFEHYPRLPREINFIFFIFIFAMASSTILSSQPVVGAQQILRVFAFVFLFYLLTSFIDTISKLNILLYSMISSGLILSLSILYEFGLQGFTISQSNDTLLRLGGFFSNVNFISVPILVATLLSVSNYVYHRSQVRYLFIIISIICLLALLLNNSRSSFLALLLASSAFLFYYNKKLFWKLFIISFLVLVVLIVGTSFMDFLEFYFRIERFASGRENWWHMAYETFSSNPIFGVGPAAFKYEMYKYLPVQLGSWEEQIIFRISNITGYGTQHNFFLFVASDLGLFGIIALIILFGIFIYSGFNSIKMAVSYHLRTAVINMALYSIGLGFFIRSLFESINIFSYGWISADLPFWLIFFAMLKINSLQKQNLANKQT